MCDKKLRIFALRGPLPQPPPETKAKPLARENHQEPDGIPVFGMDEGSELAYFVATGVHFQPTIPRPRFGPGFWKDGVFVSPYGDVVNADCKRTKSGHLYHARNVVDHGWHKVEVTPEDIVWRKAPPDWRERQDRGDWSTVETDRPELAPWLTKGGD